MAGKNKKGKKVVEFKPVTEVVTAEEAGVKVLLEAARNDGAIEAPAPVVEAPAIEAAVEAPAETSTEVAPVLTDPILQEVNEPPVIGLEVKTEAAVIETPAPEVKTEAPKNGNGVGVQATVRLRKFADDLDHMTWKLNEKKDLKIPALDDLRELILLARAEVKTALSGKA